MLRRGLIFFFLCTLPACGLFNKGGDAEDNEPPTLELDVENELEYVVGDGVIRITATASDPEGEEVTISLVDRPDRAQLQRFDGWAVMTWDPLASDVTEDGPRELVFTAEDASGNTAEKVVNVTILPGNGVPRFTNSPSVLHNIDSGKPVAFDVKVRDDDSTSVSLAMTQAPGGAGFTVTGDMSGRFGWEPTVEQLKYRIHNVTFTANDGQNDPVEQKVTIVLEKSGQDGPRKIDNGGGEMGDTDCTFENAVQHEHLGPRRGTEDYELTATFRGEAAEKFDRIVLKYTDGDAWNNQELQLEGTDMEEENGVFTASIPNPLLETGESKRFLYEMCAIDDDSTEDDAVLCGPTSVFTGFIAYSPDNESTCIDDEVDNHTFDDATPLDELAWEYHRACGDSAPDYYRVELEPHQSADVFFTYPHGDFGVDVEMYDSDRNLLPAEPSDCSGFFPALLDNDTDQPATRYFRFIGRDIPYQATVYKYAPTVTCSDDIWEPNETSGDATVRSGIGDPQDFEICPANDRDVFSVLASAGQIITAKALFSVDEGDLDMKLYAPSKQAEVDSNGIATDFSLTFDDNEEIVHTARETGIYYVVVFGYGDTNDYSFEVTVESPQQCDDMDMFAPNHTRMDADDIPVADNTGLKLCPDQSDWFELFAFDTEIVFLDVTATEGNLDDVSLKLYDGQTLLQEGMRNGDTLSITFFPTMSKAYQIEVRSISEVAYDFDVFTSMF